MNHALAGQPRQTLFPLGLSAAVEDIRLNEIMFLLSHPKGHGPEPLSGFQDSEVLSSGKTRKTLLSVPISTICVP